MNASRALIIIVVAALLGGAIYLTTRGPQPAATPDGTASQTGMSGMEGMSGMAGTAAADCVRYDLIKGAWVCTATGSGN